MAYAAVLEAFKMAEKQSGTYREALKLRAQREAKKVKNAPTKAASEAQKRKERAAGR
ncbi:hypothetical protein SAMN05216304_11449 [Bosea sp. OK403]|uniref:hypothetical protein n=1 Tax=Bosea sp. OK403 TaxID=1855286 RepID=UPI0008F251EA|nr:hypothetical protein [Bosea sp. OK403]SFJ77248.1 hypothetical protein SAMN05216304_11449 [Bosea sp. OK403]